MRFPADASCSGDAAFMIENVSGREVEHMKAVCSRCPVRNGCLDDAYEREERGEVVFGVRGGLLPFQRHRSRAAARKAARQAAW